MYCERGLCLSCACCKSEDFVFEAPRESLGKLWLGAGERWQIADSETLRSTYFTMNS